MFDQLSHHDFYARLISPFNVSGSWAILCGGADGVSESEKRRTESLAAIENEILVPEVADTVGGRRARHATTVLEVLG